MKLIASLAIFLISFQKLDCHQGHGRGRKIHSRLNFFDTELLRASAEEKKGNVMISPASVKSTLAMILAGAEGDTARQLENALRVSPHMDDLREQFHLYLSALRPNTTAAVLKSSNGVFISKKLKLYPKYESIVKLDYFSEVTRLDFNDPNSAAVTINNWVSDNTHGLIPFVVEPAQVSPSTELILTNTLYFKSSWLHSFDPRETHSSCFYTNEDCKMVAMMELQAELNYAHVEDLRAHALELLYEDKRYSMVILVPLARDGIDALIRDLPYISLPQICDMMIPKEVQLSMPKFTINYNENLVEALRKVHITSLFSNKSNLSKIFEGEAPHVNSFYHKVFMSVDETGTVAAAASAAMVVPLIFNGRVDVKVDRPFVFFIKDNELGIVLFEGTIVEPSVLEHALDSPVPPKPPVLTRKILQTVQSSNTKSKSNSFVDNLKNIFG